MHRAPLFLILLAALVVAAPATAAGPAVVLTSADQLVTFDPENPSLATAPVTVTGVQPDETLVGIDVRPQNGMLYGLGVNPMANDGTLYVIEPSSGFASQVNTVSGTVAFTTDGVTPVDFPDPAVVGYGFDLNPGADRVRVVAGPLNFRLNPNDGAPVDGNGGSAGTNPDGSVSVGTTTLHGAAYTNNVANNGGTTTLYTLDAASNSLFIQNPPNNGTQTLVSTVSLGGSTLDFTAANGFDIAAGVNAPAPGAPVATGSGLAALTVGGQTSLYAINLVNGQATSRGAIAGAGAGIRGFALYPDAGPLPAVTLAADGANLMRFSSAFPATVTTQPVTGVAAGETLVGLDWRPHTGQLLGFGADASTDQGTLYRIDPQTGAATAIGTPGQVAFTIEGVTPVQFPAPASSGWGVDVNPSLDRVRVTASTGVSFRVNPFTGAPVDGNNGGATVTGTNPDGTVEVPGGGSNEGVADVAYTNAFPQAVASPGPTTLYALDPFNNQQWILNPPNSGALTMPALVRLGAVVADFTADNGFDIPSDVRVSASNTAATGAGYAVLTVGGVTRLHQIALDTGAATTLGSVGTGATPVAGLAIGTVGPTKPTPPTPPPNGGGGTPTTPNPPNPPVPGPPPIAPIQRVVDPPRKVTLKLARSRIGRRGPVVVTVTNPNAYALTGRLAAKTTGRVKVGKRSRIVSLTSKSFAVAARKSVKVSMSLPPSLRSRLRATGKLSLRFTATVRAVGNAAPRPTTTTLTPRLKR